MEKPLVSIVMAAFNEEKHIGECIQSMLDQTYPHFEFIIVNDGSTDSTEEIILSFKDPRIVYIKNEKNLKLIKSLNKGLKAARGKYITRMDADDTSVPHRLATQVDYMEKNPATGISGAQLKLFGASQGIMRYPLTHEDICLYLLKTSCFGNNVVMFRKEIMDQHQLFFPEGYLHSEDYKCWTNWVQHTQAANLDETLVNYRSHAGSISVQNRHQQRQTRNRIRGEYLTFVFGLTGNTTVSTDFTGPLNKKRIKAIRFILNLNQQSPRFPQDRLKQVIFDLWYSDSLEKAETGLGVLWHYPRIFSIAIKPNFKNWINVLKHHIKSRGKK